MGLLGSLERHDAPNLQRQENSGRTGIRRGVVSPSPFEKNAALYTPRPLSWAVAALVFLFAFPSAGRATTLGLSEIPMPDLQPAGFGSLSFQRRR